MFSLRGVLITARHPLSRPLSSASAATPAAAPKPRPPVPEEGCLAFFGLGAMGRPMAANLRLRHEPSFTGYGGLWTTSPMDVLVWNRTTSVAEAHAEEHGTLVLDDDFKLLPEAKISFICLPTTDDVQGLLERAAPRMRRGSVVVDCTSGHPHQVREIADWLKAEFDVTYVDCAVSGGPSGAAKGTVAAFVGCDDDAVVDGVRGPISSFARNIVHLGPAGCGHAVKAINNVMNTSNMLCAAEGILALKNMGVDPAKALTVINTASGRSLMSMQRLPEEVLTGEFHYGFKLGLMRKDIQTANDIMDRSFDKSTIFRNTLGLVDEALKLDGVGFDSDYTEAVKILEHRAENNLRSDTPMKYQKK